MKNFSAILIPLSLLLIISQVLLIFSVWQLLPPLVPLLYSHPWGDTQLIQPIGLFIIPGSNFIITILNLIIEKILFDKKNLNKLLLSSGSFTCCLVGLIGLIQIIRLVI